MALRDNLKSARQEVGWSQQKLADEAGVSQQLISQIENGDPSAGKDLLPKIATALGRSVEELDAEFWTAPKPQAVRAAGRGRAPQPGISALPVYASARGGEGEIVIGNDPVDYARHPLENVTGGYTTYIVGDSMEPLFEQGDLVLVNPHIPPRPGADIILQTAESSETGERAALVKRLIRAAPDAWQLEQFNPQKRFKLDRKVWSTAHVIVGKYSRR